MDMTLPWNLYFLLIFGLFMEMLTTVDWGSVAKFAVGSVIVGSFSYYFFKNKVQVANEPIEKYPVTKY